MSKAPAPAVKEPDRLSSLPHDLVSLVLDAVSEHDMRSLAVVSSNLSPPTAHRARVGLTERAAGP